MKPSILLLACAVLMLGGCCKSNDARRNTLPDGYKIECSNYGDYRVIDSDGYALNMQKRREHSDAVEVAWRWYENEKRNKTEVWQPCDQPEKP